MFCSIASNNLFLTCLGTLSLYLAGLYLIFKVMAREHI